jgi:hypothetical protein
MARQLKDVSRDEWAGLKNGYHEFGIGGQPVRLGIRGMKIRRVFFDLFRTNREIRPEPLERFREEWVKDMRSKAVDLRKVKEPSGKTSLEIGFPAGEQGEWLYRAAQFLSDQRNLIKLDLRH